MYFAKLTDFRFKRLLIESLVFLRPTKEISDASDPVTPVPSEDMKSYRKTEGERTRENAHNVIYF